MKIYHCILLAVLLFPVNSLAQNSILDYFFPDKAEVKYYDENSSLWEKYSRNGNYLVTRMGMDETVASEKVQRLGISRTSIVVTEQTDESMLMKKTYSEPNSILLKLPEYGETIYWQNRESADTYDDYKASIKMLDVGTKEIEVIEVVIEHTIEGVLRKGLTSVQYWGKGYGLLMDSWTPSSKYCHPLLHRKNFEMKDYKAAKQTANVYPLRRPDKEIPASLQEFVDELLPVLKARDTVGIRNFLGYGFLEKFDEHLLGYDDSNEYFAMSLHDSKSEAWNKLYKVISAGGYHEKDDTYIFPWYGQAVWDYTGHWVDDEMVDEWIEAHDAVAVIGENVRVREKPDTDSSIKGTLSWQAVRVDRSYVEKGYFYADNEWFKISTVNNELEGYVNAKFIYLPSEARVVVELDTNKNWMITGFLTY